MTNELNTIAAATTAAIQTVSPDLKLGQIMISADKRSTKETPLTDAQRVRRVVLQDSLWNGIETTLMAAHSQGLHDLLMSGLKGIAAARLRDTLAENEMATVVQLSDYTIPALLSWQAESAASRGALTLDKEEVLAWFETSSMRAGLLAKHGNKAPAILAYLRTRYGALAARNHGLSKPEDASKLIMLIPEADLEGTHAAVVAEVIQRLTAITKSLEAKALGEVVSLDDL